MDVAWSVPRRIAFRFGLIAGLLYVYPFPLGTIPKTESLAEWFGKPWEGLVLWFAESVLGTEQPATEMTGSGDTLFAYVSFLLIILCAALGAAIWTALDRKRLAYPRLASASVVVLRYVLATAMLSYGFAKIIPSQFPFPTEARLDGRIGDMSPMGLLWTFMGYSAPYGVFAGLAEACGGVLLLFRRTTVAGAVVVIAVMTNVFMLNMSYDVPVKLYSAQLLLIAGLLVMPHARRLIAAVLGRATAEVPPIPRMSSRREALQLGIKIAMLACIAFGLFDQVTSSFAFKREPNEVTAVWRVESWTADGVDHAPLLTDPIRWRRLAISPRGIALRVMPDNADRISAGYELDATKHTMTVKDGEHTETWRYAKPDDDHLVIDGSFRGKQIHATLAREPDPLLVTRPFHWIQERPFNR